MRNVSNNILKKVKTYVLYSVIFFPEDRAVCDIMLKKTVEPERPQIIWCMHGA
jgi:hypothetical protein